MKFHSPEVSHVKHFFETQYDEFCNHQKCQVGFPLHKPYPYSLYRWGFLHFRYLEMFGDVRLLPSNLLFFPYENTQNHPRYRSQSCVTRRGTWCFFLPIEVDNGRDGARMTSLSGRGNWSIKGMVGKYFRTSYLTYHMFFCGMNEAWWYQIDESKYLIEFFAYFHYHLCF